MAAANRQFQNAVWALAALWMANAALAAEPASQPIATIAVVKTLGDLQKVEPITVGEYEVRLGIEATKVPQDSAVLLYCLYAGPMPAITYKNRDRGWLGPLRLHVLREDEKITPAKQVEERGGPTRSVAQLFIASVPIVEEGNIRVALTEGDTVVAEATLVGLKEVAQPWMEFGYVAEEKRPHAGQEKLEVPTERVKLTPGSQGLPRADGLAPMPTDKLDPKQPLPEALPGEDKTFVLKHDGEKLQLHSETAFASKACNHLLVRYWINGEPFAPETLSPLTWLGAVQDSRDVKDLELQIVDFKPGAFGAKAGDKFACQILYCRFGWEPVGQERIERLMELKKPTNEPPTRLSNRVEWTIGG